MAHILEEGIAPSLGDDYLRTLLAQVIGGMRRLAAESDEALRSLEAENAALEGLLASLATVMPVAIEARPPSADTADFTTANERQQMLRGALDGVIRGLNDAADCEEVRAARARVREFLRSSADNWKM